MKNFPKNSLNFKTRLRKILAIVINVVLLLQIFATPFSVYAVPAENSFSTPVAESTISSALASVSGNISADISLTSTGSQLEEDLSSSDLIGSLEGNLSVLEEENSNIEIGKIEKSESVDEKKKDVVKEKTSIVDFSTTENIEKSVVNITESVVETIKETASEITNSVSSTTTRAVRGVTRFRSAVAPSSNGSTDLTIKIDTQTEAENNRLLSHKITIENLGPSDANGANMKISLPAGMRTIKLVCKEEEKIGNVDCPNEESYTDGAREINRRIDKFPVGTKLIFEITAKLPLNSVSSINYSGEISTPA